MYSLACIRSHIESPNLQRSLSVSAYLGTYETHALKEAVVRSSPRSFTFLVHLYQMIVRADCTLQHYRMPWHPLRITTLQDAMLVFLCMRLHLDTSSCRRMHRNTSNPPTDPSTCSRILTRSRGAHVVLAITPLVPAPVIPRLFSLARPLPRNHFFFLPLSS